MVTYMHISIPKAFRMCLYLHTRRPYSQTQTHTQLLLERQLALKCLNWQPHQRQSEYFWMIILSFIMGP